MICLQSSLDQEDWLGDCDCIIPFEIHRTKLYGKLDGILKERLMKPDMDYINNMKKLSDMTRGFYALASCLQIQENINKNLKIYIIGFGGEGHHFDKDVKISHYHNEEKVLIKQLKKQNRIIDLKDSEYIE